MVVTTHGLYGVAHKIARQDPAYRPSTQRCVLRMGPLKIRVNCVAPGAIRARLEGLYAAARAATRSNPMMRVGRMGTSAECRATTTVLRRIRYRRNVDVDGGGQLWGETWTTGNTTLFSSEGYVEPSSSQQRKCKEMTKDDSGSIEESATAINLEEGQTAVGVT